MVAIFYDIFIKNKLFDKNEFLFFFDFIVISTFLSNLGRDNGALMKVYELKNCYLTEI